ncbi:MAG TPA: hypothetical protein VLX29_01295 [Nitrospirota bacterium]|nr:hypothetical protein [Nitrospirota bacterium]
MEYKERGGSEKVYRDSPWALPPSEDNGVHHQDLILLYQGFHDQILFGWTFYKVTPVFSGIGSPDHQNSKN